MTVYDNNRWELLPDGSRRRRGATAASASAAVIQHSEKSAAAAEKKILSVTPAAEKLAETLGVDLTTVIGTGLDGKITKGDVEAAGD